jgi:hypothetical protein
VVDTDCRSRECVAALDPWNAVKISKRPMAKLPWISCFSLDAIDNWPVGSHIQVASLKSLGPTLVI